MSQALNPRVMEKLKKAKCPEIIKKFLRESLFFELENIEEAHPRYRKRYDTAIEKHSKIFAEVKKK